MVAEKWPDVSTEGQGGPGIGGQTNEPKVSFEPQSVWISCWQESSVPTFSKYDWRSSPFTFYSKILELGGRQRHPHRVQNCDKINDFLGDRSANRRQIT
jgi:hypothetical protein